MSTTYTYTGKASADICDCGEATCCGVPPCKDCGHCSGIHKAVEDSAMGDKTLEHCTFIKATAVLTVVFTNALGGPDKTKLDVIITANTTDV